MTAPAEHGLIVRWGLPVRGAEVRAVAAYEALVALLERWRDDDAIASFLPVTVGAHGGDLQGFALVRGEREALQALTRTEAFRDVLIRLELGFDQVGVLHAYLDGLSLALLRRYRDVAVGEAAADARADRA